jgi:transposase
MDDTTTSTAKRTVHSSEFKREAVARLKGGCNATALALELGVKRNQLYKWAKRLDEAGAESAFKGPGRPAGVEEDELVKLHRENERLKMENTILKKAEAYFAQRKP